MQQLVESGTSSNTVDVSVLNKVYFMELGNYWNSILHSVANIVIQSTFQIILHLLTVVSSESRLYVFGLQDDTIVPRENLCKHRKNIQTPYRKDQSHYSIPGSAVRQQCYPLSHLAVHLMNYKSSLNTQFIAKLSVLWASLMQQCEQNTLFHQKNNSWHSSPSSFHSFCPFCLG